MAEPVRLDSARRSKPAKSSAAVMTVSVNAASFAERSVEPVVLELLIVSAIYMPSVIIYRRVRLNIQQYGISSLCLGVWYYALSFCVSRVRSGSFLPGFFGL